MTFDIPAFIDIKDGTYTSMLESVTVGKGGFGGADFRKWNWLVDVPAEASESGEAEIVPLTQLTSANTGPQSNSYKQLTALLGRAPKAGEKIEPPTGKRVVLQIGHNEKGFPKVLSVGAYVDPQQVLEEVPR